jgi:hypothetical protein
MAILVLFILLIIDIAGPSIAYRIMRAKASRRSDAARDHFEAGQRRQLRAHYWAGAVMVVAFAIGLTVYHGSGGFRRADLISSLAICAAIVTVFWGGMGLVVVGSFVKSARAPVPGCCAKCDYDLRGITSERCPECGKQIDI